MMSNEPKNKVAKSENSPDAKTVVAGLPSSPTPVSLVFNDVGILRHVISFVICLDAKNDWSESCERHQLVKDLVNFRGVSKTFHAATWLFMSCSPIPQVMSDVQLSKIKASVGGLDLSSLYHNFIKEVYNKWGVEEYDEEPVETIIRQFGPTPIKFAILVGREYKKMLVVKAVELIVAKSTSAAAESCATVAATAPCWLEECQVTKLVDIFWHVHMLSPCKYQADCKTMVGETIDHDAGYVNPKQHEKSDYVSKRNAIFQFERDYFPEQDWFAGRWGNDGEGTAREVLFGNHFDHDSTYAKIMMDMDGDNDCG